MSSVRIKKGDYVTVTGTLGLTPMTVWRIVKGEDTMRGWLVYVYTESTVGFENDIPSSLLDWDDWEFVESYPTKAEALGSLPA